MLQALFESIGRQAVDAAKGPPRWIPTNDPTTAKFMVGGEVVSIDLACPPVQIVAFDLDDYVSLCNHKNVCEVYVQPVDDGGQANGIKAVGLLDAENRGRVIFVVGFSKLFQLVRSLGQKPLDQRQIVRLLAQDLREAAPPGLLAMLRSVDFAAQSRSEMPTVGRERGTREFSVQAAGELPEVFPLVFPALEECGIPDCRVTIQMGLDVNLPPAPPGFHLRPLPGEIEAVIVGTCNLVTMALSGHQEAGEWSHHVYFGRPTSEPLPLKGVG
jgi:hypothetical protein